MSWRGWSKTPLRKPLPVYIAVFTCLIISICIYQRRDVPTNIMTILLGLNGVSIGGYYASSTLESRGRSNYCEYDGGNQDESDLEGH